MCALREFPFASPPPRAQYPRIAATLRVLITKLNDSAYAGERNCLANIFSVAGKRRKRRNNLLQFVAARQSPHVGDCGTNEHRKPASRHRAGGAGGRMGLWGEP